MARLSQDEARQDIEALRREIRRHDELYYVMNRPEIADAAQIEVGIGLGGHPEHLPVTGGSVPAADLADLNPVVRSNDPCVGPR